MQVVNAKVAIGIPGYACAVDYIGTHVPVGVGVEDKRGGSGGNVVVVGVENDPRAHFNRKQVAQHLALVAHVGNSAVRLVLERGLVLDGKEETSRALPIPWRLLVRHYHLVPAGDAAQLLHLVCGRVDRGNGDPLGGRRIETAGVLGLQLGYFALPALAKQAE